MTGLMKEPAHPMIRVSFWQRELLGTSTNLYLRLKDSSLSSAFLLSFWDPILSQENSLPKIT